MMGKRDKKHEVEKTLDVDASMQGSLIFKDPVNLKINGRFEGTLNTKGNLMIGEHATVNAASAKPRSSAMPFNAPASFAPVV